MSVLVAEKLAKAFGAVAAVADVSLSLEAGETTCLLGPSGSGKSTVLRMLAGLERPDGGEIRLGGRPVFARGVDVPPEHRGIGVVFQDHALFPHLSVACNIAFGLGGLARSARDRRVAELLEAFGLAERADRFPATLSGGEAQRVAVARALAPRPAVVLMDEPFAALDEGLRRGVQRDVLDRLRAEGAAVLIVSHHAGDAMRFADTLVLMAGGRVLQAGAPADCYANPRSFLAASLLGPVNRAPRRLVDPGAPDGTGDVLFRPEDVTVGSGPVAADVRASRLVAGRWETELRLGPDHLVTAVGSAPVPSGSTAMAVTRFSGAAPPRPLRPSQ